MLAALGCLLLLLLGPAVRADAYTVQQHPGEKVSNLLTISPTVIEINADPGDTVFHEITVANRTGNTITLDFTTEDFEGSKDPDVPTVLLGNQAGELGARSWVTPEINQFTANHGDTLTLRVKTTIPPDAEPGGHYAVFLAGFSSQVSNPNGGGVNMVSRVGCFYLIRVKGPAIELGSLDSPEAPRISWHSPIDLSLVFNNLGNVHLHPSGTMRIKNMLGMTVAEIPINEWIVMPDASRRTQLSWEPGLLFGRYTTEAEVAYGEEAKTVVSTGSFWAFSWQILAGLAALLLMIAGLIMYRRKRRRLAAAAALAAASAAAAGPATEPLTPELLPLSEVMPGSSDDRVIDINDEETRTLLRELVAEELELYRMMVANGELEAAAAALRELRMATVRLRFFDVTVVIDDLLFSI